MKIYQKNEECEVEIVGLGHEGEGVGRTQDGFTLFVNGALHSEIAWVKIIKVKKQFGYAKLLNVLQKSLDRVEPPCEIFSQCGDCQLQHLSYTAQLIQKRQMVVDNLERIGKLKEDVKVHATLGMSDPWRYRNKAQMPFGEQNGGLISGFYAQGSHRIIAANECHIQHRENDKVIDTVKKIAKELGIHAYKEETHRGLLRHVVVKHGFSSKETMVVLITNGESIPNKDELVNLIRQEIPSVVSICQNINRGRTNVIFGNHTKVLWGSETIRDSIGGIQFLISVLVSPYYACT